MADYTEIKTIIVKEVLSTERTLKLSKDEKECLRKLLGKTSAVEGRSTYKMTGRESDCVYTLHSALS